MKFKKLWAMLIVFSLLIPCMHLSAATDDNGNATVEYWEQKVQQNDLDAIYQAETTDELSTTNSSDLNGKRIDGKPETNVQYVVVQSYDEVSNDFYIFSCQ